MPEPEAIVFVVDDDESVRESLGGLIRSAGMRVETFASAQQFLASPRSNSVDAPSCLVLDVHLPGLSGLDLQNRMAERDIEIPIIFITGRGDIPTVLAGFHPEIEWRQAEGNPYQPDGAAWVGPQAVLEKLFMRIGSEWEGFTVTVRTLHDAGEYVVMEGRYTGLYKPSGKSVDAQMCHVMRFRDGKLLSFQQYVDTGQLQKVMAMH